MEALYPEDPSTIGPYRLLGRLGEGGMGRVFLGRSPSGRIVAVKVVHSGLAREPHFRRRFRAEIEAARRVSGVWTAPVLDHDIESAVPWVATGYVAGPSLREVVDSLHGPLPEHSVWALAYGLASALMAVHGNGLIHRDLKPSNVMVTLEGPKVIDFGIARWVDASVVTQTGGMVGSPGYMPPEQIKGEELTGAADVFAMGAVLAYAATGMSPFSWDGAHAPTVIYRVLNDEPNLGPQDGPLKGDLRTIVLHCLAKDADERLGLAGIPPFAEKRAGKDYWLPSGLTARLGQASANLLAFDGPDVDRPPSSWGPRPSSAWDPQPSPASSPSGPSDPSASSRSTGGHSQTTQIPGEFGKYQAPAPQGSSSLAVASPPTPTPPTSPPAPPPAPPFAAPSTQPPARRPRRRRLVLGAASGAVALAVTTWLIVANVGDGAENQQADPGTDDGTNPDPLAGDGPLADLVPQDVREAGGITVHAGSNEHDPVLFEDEENGELSGFEVDLVEAIGEKLGVAVTFDPTDESDAAAANAVQEDRESAGHIAVGNFVDNDRERDELQVDMVNHFVDGWAVVSEDPERSGDLDELCGLTIIAYADSPESRAVRDDTADCPQPSEIVPASTKDEMAEAIDNGEADVAVMLYTQASYYVEVENPDAGLSVRYSDEERGSRGIAIPTGEEGLRQAVYQAVGALMDDGTYADLLQRWHMDEAALNGPDVNRG